MILCFYGFICVTDIFTCRFVLFLSVYICLSVCLLVVHAWTNKRVHNIKSRSTVWQQEWRNNYTGSKMLYGHAKGEEVDLHITVAQRQKNARMNTSSVSDWYELKTDGHCMTHCVTGV